MNAGKTRKKQANEIKQGHHLIYPSEKNKEHIEDISKTEHFLIHKVQRHTRNVTKGFLRCLRFYILLHEKDAIDLPE